MHFACTSRNSKKVEVMIAENGAGAAAEIFHKAQCLKGLRTAVNQIPDKKQFCILRELRKQFFKTFKAPLKVADGE